MTQTIPDAGKLLELAEAMASAFEPFIDLRHMRGEGVKLISRHHDGFSPVNLTLTKAQMLAAFRAHQAFRTQASSDPAIEREGR